MLLALLAVPAGAQTISYATRTLDSTEIRVGKGEPVTIVAVFATWCTTCRNEFGTLDSLHHVLTSRGIRVLALSVDEWDDAHVRKYTAARRTHERNH